MRTRSRVSAEHAWRFLTAAEAKKRAKQNILLAQNYIEAFIRDNPKGAGGGSGAADAMELVSLASQALVAAKPLSARFRLALSDLIDANHWIYYMATNPRSDRRTFAGHAMKDLNSAFDELGPER